MELLHLHIMGTLRFAALLINGLSSKCMTAQSPAALVLQPAVMLLCRDAVQGDPSQWSKILAGLEAVRQATRPSVERLISSCLSQAI